MKEACTEEKTEIFGRNRGERAKDARANREISSLLCSSPAAASPTMTGSVGEVVWHGASFAHPWLPCD